MTNRLRPLEPIAVRFWSRVLNRDGKGCWTWVGQIDRQRYGFLKYSGDVIYAHRLSWLLNVGPIVGNKFVLHHCDNPPCVNPHHLYIGTPQDNSRDQVARQRRRLPKNARPGERNPHAALSDVQVEQIRRLFREKTYSGPELAGRFGVSRTQIYKIIRRHAWKGVSP